MFRSFTKLLLLISVSGLVFSCTSNEAKYTFDKKPVSSVESKDGNIVVHFKDHTTQSFSAAQVETLLKEKKMGESVYPLFAQKIKDAASRKQQQKPAGKAGKEQYPYRLNGMDVHYVELKNDKFVIHMADKASHSFLQHELDCMLINHIITEELYFKCIQKREEANITADSGFSFSYREIKCPEFN